MENKMKLIAFTAAALLTASTGAYAAGGAVTGNVPQTTVQNGLYGGDPEATIIAINQRDNAMMYNRPIQTDRLNYSILALIP
jgi:hypothetical protein